MCGLLVKLENMDSDGIVTVRREDNKSHTGGQEYWCSIARYYGWKACEQCDDTDGSVDCAHHTEQDMLVSAGEFLSAHVGDETDDPGWWDER